VAEEILCHIACYSARHFFKLHAKVYICRGSGLPLPKVYRGPSTSEEESVEDQVDSCVSTTETNVPDIDSESQEDWVCVERPPSTELDSTPTEGSDTDDLMPKKGVVETHNHCGEGVGDPVLQNLSDAADCLSKYEICDTVADAKNDECTDRLSGDPDRLSGDPDADRAVCKHCKELDDYSNETELENPISTPISIPGVVNGARLPRRMGSISEDPKATTHPTSGEVGSGSSAHFPSLYDAARRMSIMSNPRFTPAGSFIIPADEDIYVDYSCGLFSTEACDTGRVLDVSTLPSPPDRPFTIGDEDESDLCYFSANDSVATALTQSCQYVRSRETSGDINRHHSCSELGQSVDVKVSMVDATSREVLDEIFKRTSGRFASVILYTHE